MAAPPRARVELSVATPTSPPARAIHLRNCRSGGRVRLALLRRVTRCLLAEVAGLADFDVGVCLVSPATIRRLNETFLRHAGVTDVIAFDYTASRGEALREPNRPPRSTATRLPAHRRAATPRHALAGEVFICLDEAARQARRFRVSCAKELTRYLVHGVLHLLGYADDRPAARRRMKRHEQRWLRQLEARFALDELLLAPPKTAPRPRRQPRSCPVGHSTSAGRRLPPPPVRAPRPHRRRKALPSSPRPAKLVP